MVSQDDRGLQEQLQLCFTTLQRIASNLATSMASTESTSSPAASSSSFSLPSQPSASGPLVSNPSIPAVVTTSSADASVEGFTRKSSVLIMIESLQYRCIIP